MKRSRLSTRAASRHLKFRRDSRLRLQYYSKALAKVLPDNSEEQLPEKAVRFASLIQELSDK